jgi:YfiH family protein
VPTPWRLDAQWPVPGSVHGFTTLRHGLGTSKAPFDSLNLGLRAGDDAQAVSRNRELLIEHARLPSRPLWLRQVHGVQVYRFDGPHPNPLPQAGEGAHRRDARALPQAGLPMPGLVPPNAGEGLQMREVPPLPLAGEGRGEGAFQDEPEADAAVTSMPGHVLAILTADCMPVLFCADDGREVGAAHAGWRGLAGGVLENTVRAMRTPPDRLHAWLGPAAGPQQYEIGEEVYDAFVSQDWSAGAAFVTTRAHHWRVDLYALARRRLQALGIAAERIHGGGLCTISDAQRFFSHRRDHRTGRMASLIWIEPRAGVHK